MSKDHGLKQASHSAIPEMAEVEYLAQIAPLHIELVKMQNWVKAKGLRVVALFEGRDASGKGGAIKRLTEHVNPRGCRVIALDKPTPQEESGGRDRPV